MTPAFADPASDARPRRRAVAARVRGVTLIELMVTLAIAGIVVALGAPSFLRMLARHAIAAQAEELQDAVRIGRDEAMKRGGPVVLCRTDAANVGRCAAGGGSWQTWLLFADAARSGTMAAGDAILRQHLDVSSRMTVAGGAASVRFEATGIARSDDGAIVFVLSPSGSASVASGGDRALQRKVCVNRRGEAAVIAGGAACP